MSSFVIDLKKRFNNRCVLSNVITTEANHIIPKFVCSHLGLDNLIISSYNGLLMTDSLHREFDRYFWALDIHNIIWSDDKSWISLPIVIRPQTSNNLMINLFQEKLIKVPVQSLSYLWVHYQIFLTYNFTKFNKNQLWVKYRDLIYSDNFKIINNNPLLIDSIRSIIFSPSHIISSRNFNNEMLVIDCLRPLSEMIWLSIEHLNPLLIEEYLDKLNDKTDPDWLPSKNYLNKNGYSRRFSLRLQNK